MKKTTAWLLILMMSGCGPGSTPVPTPPPSPTPTPDFKPLPEPAEGSFRCDTSQARGYQAVAAPVMDDQGRALVEVRLTRNALSASSVGDTAARLGVVDARATDNGFVGYMDRRQARSFSLQTAEVVVIYEIGLKSVGPVSKEGPISSPKAVRGVSWAWDRVNQLTKDLDRIVASNAVGSEPYQVHVYIPDTGVNCSEPELDGRCGEGWAYNGGSFADDNGHGSAVAALIAGRTAGGAAEVIIHPVKVLRGDGVGYDNWVANGVDWIRSHCSVNGWCDLSVVSASLGGGESRLVSQAFARVAVAGAWTFVAAGNSGPNVSSCDGSPSEVACAWTIGSIGRTDARSWFSQPGFCTDIHAPGEEVDSGILGWHDWAGTSAATPIAAAVAVRFVQARKTQVDFWNAMNFGVLTDVRGAQNALVYIGSEDE